MEQTIDTYRLTDLEEPSDEVLSELMKEAAEEAWRGNDEATARYFEQLKVDTRNICVEWQ